MILLRKMLKPIWSVKTPGGLAHFPYQWRRDARSGSIDLLKLRLHFTVFIVVSENEKDVSQFLTDFQQILAA